MNIQGTNSAVASGLDWRTSSLCGNDACVEVAIAGNKAFLRSSKNVGDGYLTFEAEEWRAFVDGVRNHEFDID